MLFVNEIVVVEGLWKGVKILDFLNFKIYKSICNVSI